MKDVSNFSCFAGLQHTKLGEVLENRVNEFLKKNNAGAGEVTIRVVSSVDKIAEIKPGMKTRYAVVHYFTDGIIDRSMRLFRSFIFLLTRDNVNYCGGGCIHHFNLVKSPGM